MNNDTLALRLSEVAQFIFDFAQVNRATYFPDGKRNESDTDHTVMLAIFAPSLADVFYKNSLNIGLVSQYAIVHDLVETYAGDSNGLDVTPEALQEKKEREEEALHMIQEKFDSIFPYISNTISSYEKMDTKEARFVKTVDKLLPKLTHILDGGQYFKIKNMNEKELRQKFLDVKSKIFLSEFPELEAFFTATEEEVVKKTFGV